MASDFDDSDEYRVRQIDLIRSHVALFRDRKIDINSLVIRLEGIALVLFDGKVPPDIWTCIEDIEEVNAVLIDQQKKPDPKDFEFIETRLSFLETTLRLSRD